MTPPTARALPTLALLFAASMVSGGCEPKPPEQPWFPAAVEPPAVTSPRDAQPPAEGMLSVDIIVEVPKPESGTFHVHETWRGITSPLRFKRHGDDSYRIEAVKLSVDGKPRKARRNGRVWRAEGDLGSDHVTVSYRVRPGGDGAGGRQGILEGELALGDGRAWLLPISRQPIGAARIRFDGLEGWTAATSLPRGDDGWHRYPADLDPRMLTERLRTDCWAMGRFDRVDHAIGDVTVSSFVHTELKPGFTTYLHGATGDLARWTHERLGLPPIPQAYVRTGHREKGLYGGASLAGACFEGRHPDRSVRNAEVLARRMIGPWITERLLPADPAEAWWREALPRTLSQVAVEASGALESGLLGPDLWKAHQSATDNRPLWAAMPLHRAPRVDNPTREYLHRTRGPLVLHSLAAMMALRSDTTLEAVLRDALAQPRGPVRLQELLERGSGTSLADVFAAYVDGGLPLTPMVPGVVDDWVRDRARRPAPLRTAGYPVPTDYLVWLAASGRFATYGELLDHVGHEGPRRRALAERKVRLASEEALAHLGGLDPRTRFDLVDAETRWPVHLVAAPLGALAPQLAFDDHPVARHLRELRASERAYEAALGTHDVNAIAVRPGFKDAAEKTGDTLVVRPDQPFTIYVRYRRPYHQLSVELWMHGERHVGVPVTMEPGWNRNRIEVGVGNRPATEGVMTIKVLGPDGELVASRDLWQHP